MFHRIPRRTHIALLASAFLALIAGCSSYNYNPHFGGGGWGGNNNVWVHGNGWGHTNNVFVARGGYYHPGRW